MKIMSGGPKQITLFRSSDWLVVTQVLHYFWYTGCKKEGRGTKHKFNCLYFRMKREFIILSTDGPHGNVLKMKPPMTLNRDDVDYFCSKLAMVLKELENKNNNAIFDINITTIDQSNTSSHNDNKVTDILSEVEFNGNFPLAETTSTSKSLKVY